MTWQTILRRVALGLLVPLVGLLLAVALLLGRLAQGPLDVTGLSHRWGGALTHAGGGRLHWERMALSWKPGKNGHSAKILLSLEGVRYRALPEGGGADEVAAEVPEQQLDHVGVVFRLASLLHGQVGLRSLDVRGLRLVAFRDAEGHVSLGGVKPGAQHPGGGTLPPLAAIMPWHLDLQDIRLTIRDETAPDSSLIVTLPELKADHDRQTGWQGRMEASLQGVGLGAGQEEATVHLAGDMAPDGAARTRWQLTVSPVRFPALAAWLPLSPAGKKGMGIPNMPLAFHLEGILEGHGLVGHFAHMAGEVDAGAGEIDRPGRIPFRLSSGKVSFHLDPAEAGQQAPLVLALHTELAALDSLGRTVPFIIDAHGRLDHLDRPKDVELLVDGHVPTFDFATLASVWPDGTARGARRWMTTNMTAGRGENLHLQLDFTSNTGLDGLDVRALGGELTGHSLSVTWMEGMPQVTGEDAYAHFVDDDRLLIDVQHGHLADGRGGSVTVPTGHIVLSDLLKREQTGEFSLGMEGPLSAFVAVLSYPRLNLLSRHPVNPANTGGMLKGTLSLKLPLNSHLLMKDVGYGAEFDFQNIWFALPSLGRIQQGNGHFSVNEAGLAVKGGARFRGVMMTGSLFDSFQANVPGRLMLKADLQASLGAKELRSLGVPAGLAQDSIMQGSGVGHVVYSQYGGGPGHSRGTASVQVDLRGLGVRARFWHKPVGVPAGLQAGVTWQDGQMIRLDDVRAHGPQLALQAEGRMRSGQLGGINLTHFQFGRTSGSAVMDWPVRDGTADDRRYQISVQASTLDLTPWFGHPATGKSRSQPIHPVEKKVRRAPGSAGQASILPEGIWAIGLRADRVIYGAEQTASHVSANLRWAAQRVQGAFLHVAQPSLTFDLAQDSRRIGVLDVRLIATDLGRILASLGVYGQLAGGTVDLQGHCQPVAADAHVTSAERTMGLGLGLPPFDGTLAVDHLTLKNPPTALVIATLAAPLHWGQISRKQFEDVQLRASFRVAGERLDLAEARAGNAILGVTMKGQMDFGQAMMQMQGTISPFFGINQAAGSFFGARKGSGIMAMTYRLDGSLAKPQMHVNPFSALLPGGLRRLFE